MERSDLGGSRGTLNIYIYNPTERWSGYMTLFFCLAFGPIFQLYNGFNSASLFRLYIQSDPCLHQVQIGLRLDVWLRFVALEIRVCINEKSNGQVSAIRKWHTHKYVRPACIFSPPEENPRRSRGDHVRSGNRGCRTSTRDDMSADLPPRTNELNSHRWSEVLVLHFGKLISGRRFTLLECA